MLMNADMMLIVANDRRRQMVAEAERSHLLASARRARKARKISAVRGQPTGTLASCDPSAAVPVR